MGDTLSLAEAISLIRDHGGDAITLLKDKILLALLDADDVEALRLDTVLQSVEKIFGLGELEEFPIRLH